MSARCRSAPIAIIPCRCPARENPLRTAFNGLRDGLKNRDFWLLAGTFFVCGFTTNGLVGTHMIALCGDHGMDAVAAGGLLAMMGFFDLVGTTASGWLTDRYDPRKLLFAYYGLRGLSLIYLPFANFTFRGLSLFAVFYGLDWIATVPPTLALSNRVFGSKRAPGHFRLDLRQPSGGRRPAPPSWRACRARPAAPIWKPLWWPDLSGSPPPSWPWGSAEGAPPNAVQAA